MFEEVAEVDWSTHIPLLIDYWCRVLLGHQNYQGTILGAHRPVHELQPLTADLFDRWYGLWVATIDQGWAGPSAEKAKAHAAKIAGSLAASSPRSLGIPHAAPSLQGKRAAMQRIGWSVLANDQSASGVMGILRHELLHGVPKSLRQPLGQTEMELANGVRVVDGDLCKWATIEHEFDATSPI